ncbi:hypothetical protein RFI_10751, partial [Reticulomyxa filosa]
EALIEEKKEVLCLEKRGDELEAQVKTVKGEMEELQRKLKEKEMKQMELQEELLELSEDKCALQNSLKHLNKQVGNVTEIQSKMDGDFAKLNEDKIQLKAESREWKHKYGRLEKEMKEVAEAETKRTREMMDKHEELLKTHDDIKLELSKRDDEIHQLKAELEQLQGDLQVELKEKTSKDKQLKAISHKVDKLTTKNAQLQEHMRKLEDQLDGSVTRQEWEALRTEYNDLHKKLDMVTVERDKISGEIGMADREKNKLLEEIIQLKKEVSQKQENITMLESHQNFWRSRANSIQEELQKILLQARPAIVSPHTSTANHPHV